MSLKLSMKLGAPISWQFIVWYLPEIWFVGELGRKPHLAHYGATQPDLLLGAGSPLPEGCPHVFGMFAKVMVQQHESEQSDDL